MLYLGKCLGNLISNENVVRNSELKIPSFGLTLRGEYMVGYLGEDQVDVNDFQQLISGVVWLVRNGTNNVQNAIELEDDSIQGTFCKTSHIWRISQIVLFEAQDFTQALVF